MQSKEVDSMKKIINDPAHVVSEMLDGMTKTYPQLIKRIPNTNVIIRSDLDSMKDKVAIISGGGSGHEPAHAGFVGPGMLSAAIAGQVFTSPTPDQIYEAIKATNQGKGVFLIIKNYSGDVMNFEMAKDLAIADGINVQSIIVDDDIAVENSTYTQGKRGVAGTIFMHKILGAAASLGASLDEITQLSQEILPYIKTISFALNAATVPEVGKPGFELKDDEIEFGVGIHSEPGAYREKLKSSYDLAQELLDKIDHQMSLSSTHQYAILINGLGATPLMEQYIFANDVYQLLQDKKIIPQFSKVGNYMTSIDMAGLSLTLLEIKDKQWLDYLNYPVKTIAW